MAAVTIGAVVALLAACSSTSGDQADAGSPTSATPVAAQADDAAADSTKAPPATHATKPEPVETPKPTHKAEPSHKAKPKKQPTASQEQALGAAEDYLDFQGFSRQGLIDQLHSDYGDGFSKADATWAVDHMTGVDWNKQAVRAAKNYLEIQHFSRKGLIDQLSSAYGDHFTRAQATYAADHVGLK